MALCAILAARPRCVVLACAECCPHHVAARVSQCLSPVCEWIQALSSAMRGHSSGLWLWQYAWHVARSPSHACSRTVFYTDAVRGEDGLLALVRDDLSGLTLVASSNAVDEFLTRCGVDGGIGASKDGPESDGNGGAGGSSSGTQGLSSLEWSRSKWRAFEIRMGAGAEVPGVISLVSEVLSSRGISILNFATYDSDIVLVKVRFFWLHNGRPMESCASTLSLFAVLSYELRRPTLSLLRSAFAWHSLAPRSRHARRCSATRAVQRKPRPWILPMVWKVQCTLCFTCLRPRVVTDGALAQCCHNNWVWCGCGVMCFTIASQS